jgi:hypothetical protein
VVLNDPTLVGAVSDSRLSLGFSGGRAEPLHRVQERARHGGHVCRQPRRADAHRWRRRLHRHRLPGYVHYTNLGFESLSVQNDPTAPVTNSLGSLNINGTVLQGQVRFWGLVNRHGLVR